MTQRCHLCGATLRNDYYRVHGEPRGGRTSLQLICPTDPKHREMNRHDAWVVVARLRAEHKGVAEQKRQTGISKRKLYKHWRVR